MRRRRSPSRPLDWVDGDVNGLGICGCGCGGWLVSGEYIHVSGELVTRVTHGRESEGEGRGGLTTA